ncbi:DNA polymerase Y family protein [Halococcoides cellulosivorans]|uniref:DNA polymerase IV n=1 Tax=Halococcoides cellulosivorans TaxID=1679096 RepID=A0A2R4X0K4_9EURY|nr:DNA polymerase IV [Halococcoides cellulosivorans]AWB27317.1 DNA polymerase IV [Halococcoides cellulosivorans]
MPDGHLPGVDTGTDRIVAHVDMDCFYAACERRREPELRGEPVVVGMGYESGSSGGVVATASYEARAVGVESAQPIETALDRLPRRGGESDTIESDADSETDASDANIETGADGDTDAPTGIYRPVDLNYYESVSDEVMAILRERADRVRAVSIDEAYLDVTDRTDWDDVAGFVDDLRAAVDREVGVTASVGVAPTMSAAKVASDRDKPDGCTVVPPGSVREFFAELDVEAIHEVGPTTARELREMGIETAGDLAGADVSTLESRFGERGRTIWRYARGEDDRPVEPMGAPKSFSRQSSFAASTADSERLHDRLDDLARAVGDRARHRDALYRTIGVRVVTPPFDVHTRERSLPGPVADRDLLVETVHDLAREFEGDRVRKVGVRVSNLSFSEREQTALTGYGGGGDRRRPPQRSLADFRDGSDDHL